MNYSDLATTIAEHVDHFAVACAVKGFIPDMLKTLAAEDLDKVLLSMKTHRNPARFESLSKVIFGFDLQSIVKHKMAVTVADGAIKKAMELAFAHEYYGEEVGFQWTVYEKDIMDAIKHVAAQ